MAQNIVIYQDEGVGEFGLACLRDFFKDDRVRLADASAIIGGDVFQGADLFVMPGGADLPYCRKLNGTGNKNIRAFVENGGTYLGICAGAYYACREIEYHKGRSDEICGPRELALIDATAIGSIPELAPWYDVTLKTAAIARIVTEDNHVVSALYHGGPHFDIQDKQTQILARYKDIVGNPPAIVTKSVGQGHVILSGLHLEATPACLANHPLEEDGDAQRLEILQQNMQAPNTIQGHALLRTLLKRRV